MVKFVSSWKGKLVLAIPFFIAILALVTYSMLLKSFAPKGKEIMTLVVPAGAMVGEIGKQCQELGIIRDAGKFRFLAKVTGLDRKLRAGTYRFPQGESPLRVLEALATGATVGDKLVIPEGSTMAAIAKIVKQEVGVEEDSFLAIAGDPAVCRKLGVWADNLEGYLYPDSYELAYGLEAEQVVGIMVERFFEVFGEEERRRGELLGFTTHQIVTLASMVEREARIDEERPLIAAVYHNRLRKGRLLQCDATVLYALSDHKKRLLYRDLKVESPYNTYLHKGLPPGPICSPGKSSILAVLHPADVEYLYYVAKGDGSHIFSRTQQEHQRAKRVAKRYQRSRGRG